MKRSMKNKKIQMTVMLIAFAFVFTACGKQKPENISEDLEQIENNGTAQTKGEGLNAMLAVDEEKFVDSVTLGSKTIDINAEIVVPDVDSMKIVTLESMQIDREYKKSLLEKLFDKPYVLDEMDPPQWYIDKYIEGFKIQRENYLSGETEPADKDYYEYINGVLEAWEKRDAGAFKDKVSTDYEEEVYYGEYRGNTYEIIIGNGVIYLHPADYNEMTHFQASSGHVGRYGLYGAGENLSREGMIKALEAVDNHCEISLEEAQKMAEDFIQGLGYTGFSCCRIDALSWCDMEEESPVPYEDGYQFTFYREIDGIAINQDKSIFGCLKHGAYDKDYNMVEVFDVSVTDVGVIEASAYYLHEEKEILTENTKLLSYQQVKDVFKSVLSEDPAYFQFIATTETLNVLELTYYLMEEEDTAVVIPVWRLSKQDTHFDIDAQENVAEIAMFAVMINAIDGSVIDPGPRDASDVLEAE